MGTDSKKINDDLIRFWNEAIALSEEEKEQIRHEDDLDYRQFAPSAKLLEAAESLGGCSRVLDYGCGSGWASFAIAKAGCPHVDAADLGKDILDALSLYSERFGLSDRIHPILADPNWLKGVPDATYGGVICSNVLDVVPVETGDEILANLSRVATKDARIVIGLNFYLSPEAAMARKMELVEGKYLFVQGILRLLSLSDAQWRERFAPYFAVERLDYFAWPGEEKETRRLFTLRKK